MTESQLYYCETTGSIEQFPRGGFDVCCERGPEGHEPISWDVYRAIRAEAVEEIVNQAEDRYLVHLTEVWLRGIAERFRKGERP